MLGGIMHSVSGSVPNSPVDGDFTYIADLDAYGSAIQSIISSHGSVPEPTNSATLLTAVLVLTLCSRRFATT